MDILALVPLDLLYLVFGTKAVFLRAPRLLKIQSFWEFFKLLDRVISSPHMVCVQWILNANDARSAHYEAVDTELLIEFAYNLWKMMILCAFTLTTGTSSQNIDLHVVYDPLDRMHLLCL